MVERVFCGRPVLPAERQVKILRYMRKQETICTHPSPGTQNHESAATSAIFPAVAYNYLNAEQLLYPGFFTTYNQKRLGEIVAELEGGELGLVFNSGMAAISTTILSLVKAGDHILFFNELYGGTWRFATEELPQRGIQCSFAENSLESFEAALQSNTRLVYLETPSNPLMSIIDLEEIAYWAKKHNLITLVDNTFATPINQRPIALGIDIVLHSGTKYLGGHNDLPFGVMVANTTEYKSTILSTAKLYGGFLSALSCYEAERSIKTLVLRVERQNENALKIAQYLESLASVKKVFYPGLPAHKDYLIAKKQMSGFGGMMSFELDCTPDELPVFLSELSIIKPALSLGGVESLICVPAATSHSGMTKAERNTMGISDSLIRLSVGIENCQDLIEDIAIALNSIGK